MKAIEAEHILRWTMLLHDAGKPKARVQGPDKDHFRMHPAIGEEIARTVLKRLKFDNQTVRQVTKLVQWHDRRFGSPQEVSKKTVRRWVSELTPQLFSKLMKIQKADISAQSDYNREEKEKILAETNELFLEILEAGDALSVKDLKITGKDLMEMGIPQGKEIGEFLNWLLDQVLLHPDFNTKENLIKMIREKRNEK